MREGAVGSRNETLRAWRVATLRAVDSSPVAYGSSRPCSHMGWLHVSHTKLRFDIRPKGILILARQRALVHTFVELLKMELMSC